MNTKTTAETIRARELLSFIEQSPTSSHASAEIAKMLSGAGFNELFERDRWNVQPGGKYFVRRKNAALVAFVLSPAAVPGSGCSVAVAHLDSPGLKLKLESVTAEAATKTLKSAVEVYGGPIISTWLDRPLHLAGTVSIEDNGQSKPVNMCTDTAVAVVPNPAIHMNREINKSFAYNAQTHLCPVFASGESLNNNSLGDFLAETLNVKSSSICGADLFLCCPRGELTGIDQSLITAPRLDDLAMCEAIVKALLAVQFPTQTAMAMFSDHEEIGSKTPVGADSTFLESVLKRLTFALGGDEVDVLRLCADSFLISADMAHAIHPNFKDKHDPAYAPVMNGGPVIKAHAGMKYTTTAEGAARFTRLCKAENIPVQQFIPKSDQPTGSTVGPLIAGRLGIPSIDIGNPLWAMHSCMETAGVGDHLLMTTALSTFFQNGQ